MNVITNNFEDVEVVNLDKEGAGRGPFLVMQGGFAPDDKAKKDELFLLRRDGLWVAWIYYLAANQPEMLDEAVFKSSEEIMGLLGRLGSKASVMKTQVSEESMKAWQERTMGTDPLQNLWKWAEGYKERHGKD